MVKIYHERSGTVGARMMRDILALNGIDYSITTVKKYYRELSLRSVIRTKKAYYNPRGEHHIFPDLLQQHYQVSQYGYVWCIDFTYINIGDGKMAYNCSVIDLYRREIVSSVNGLDITSELAIKAVEKAILFKNPKRGLLLHSDQGSQFTSKKFNKYCKEHQIQQSMSRAGCPTDNAVMERYYNTLKHECINLYCFESYEHMNQVVQDFVHGWYNTKRPHTYNNGQPPSVESYTIQ